MALKIASGGSAKPDKSSASSNCIANSTERAHPRVTVYARQGAHPTCGESTMWHVIIKTSVQSDI